MHSMVGGLQGDLTRLVRVPVLARKVKVVAFVKPKKLMLSQRSPFWRKSCERAVYGHEGHIEEERLRCRMFGDHPRGLLCGGGEITLRIGPWQTCWESICFRSPCSRSRSSCKLVRCDESPEVVAEHLCPHPGVGTRGAPTPVVGGVLQQTKEGVEPSPGKLE